MISDYFPQMDYGGGTPGVSSFQQPTLESVYGQSYDITSLTKAAFKQYLAQAQDVTNKFKYRVGIMELEANRMREDLLNAPSAVQAQLVQALDQNLKLQSSVAASLEGPVTSVNRMLMNKSADQAHAIFTASIGKRMQEEVAMKSMYYNQLDKNNKNILAGLGGLSSATMNGMTNTVNFARGGLTTALGAASSMVKNRLTVMQQALEARQMELNYETALANAETNTYVSQMGYLGGIEQAMINAQAQNYGDWMDAQSNAYATYVGAQSNLYGSQLGATTNIYNTVSRSRDVDRIARMREDQDLIAGGEQDEQGRRQQVGASAADRPQDNVTPDVSIPD